MGEYNPNAPQIIGEEWVPILEQPYDLELSLERGHRFSLPAAAVLGGGGFYLAQLPSQILHDQVPFMSVYQAGRETTVGPVQRLVISVWNTYVNHLTNVTLVGTTYQQEAVANPTDSRYMRFDPGSGRAQHYFDMDLVTNTLSRLVDKRIVGVNIMYTMAGSAFPTAAGSSMQIAVAGRTNPGGALASTTVYQEIASAPATLAQGQILRCGLGEVSPFWGDDDDGIIDPTTVLEQYPWNYDSLHRFNWAADRALTVDFISTNIPAGASVEVGYVAMEILYCEENRIAFGGKQVGTLTSEIYGDFYRDNMNLLPLVDVNHDYASLAPGDYTYTLRLASCRPSFAAGTTGQVNAARQLYEIRSHPGSTITVPVEEDDRVSSASTDQLPQIELFDITEGEVNDLFDRVIGPGGWGSATTGQTYAHEGNLAHYAVTGTVGTQDLLAANSPAMAYLSSPELWSQSGDYYAEVSTSALAAGAPLYCHIYIGGIWLAGIRFETDQVIRAQIQNFSLGVELDGADVTGLTHVINTFYSIRAHVIGSTVSVRVWETAGVEPLDWHATCTTPDADGGWTYEHGLRSIRAVGNTNVTVTSWDNFRIGPWTAMLDPHVYGTQFPTPVYDDGDDYALPLQRVLSIAGAATVAYPWIRFYARRFGTRRSVLEVTVAAPAGPVVYGSIDSDDFDQLDDIVAGWREVTLRLEEAAVLDDSGATFDVTWAVQVVPGESGTNVSVAERWEIVAAHAPATTEPYGQLPVDHPLVLDPATYGGTAAELVIFSTDPVVDDAYPQIDAMVIFSQDPPTVDYFTAGQQVQALAGIGTVCMVTPCCHPTGIIYNELLWDDVVFEIADLFERTVAVGWGETDTGQTWETVGGAAAQWFVDFGSGVVDVATVGGRYWSTVLMSLADPNILVSDITALDNPTVASNFIYVAGRWQDDDNFYAARVEIVPGGSGILTLVRMVAGVEAQVGAEQLTLPAFDGTAAVRFQIIGDMLRARVWAVGHDEPEVWHVTGTDTNIAGAGRCGVAAMVDVGSTLVLPTRFFFDGVNITDASKVGAFSRYEIQRQDDIDVDWQTIAMFGCHQNTVFNDYEARVSIPTRYRIRVLNIYDFAGPWSGPITATIPAPGVVGYQVGNSVLIFTSNERQDGDVNLAHTMGWQSNPEETFTFHEAGNVQFQEFFNRDYQVAFKPLERGGEQFSRTLLVQSAAIPPPKLGDFYSLRDMAWATVSYIAVRDETGSRWLAAVQVPDGNVRRNRSLYLARVDITEVTATPSVVSTDCGDLTVGS